MSYSFFAYDPAALNYNSGTFTLDPDYDYSQDRHHFEIQDNDTYFDGDRQANETGDDDDQTATVTDMDGNVVAEGQVYVEQYGTLQAPDGTIIYIDRIEIDGVNVGYVPSAPIEPGVVYNYVGGGDVHDEYSYDSDGDGVDDSTSSDTRQEYEYYEANSVACFTLASLIDTSRGLIPAGWLRSGDQVVTKDHGLQPLRIVTRTTLRLSDLLRAPEVWPVQFAAGTLRHLRMPSGLPRKMVVSPWHRVLLSGSQIALHFGQTEVFAAASHFASTTEVSAVPPSTDVTYVHLHFERHEIVSYDGFWTESFFDPNCHTFTARSCLKRWEVLALLGASNSAVGEMSPEMRAAG